MYLFVVFTLVLMVLLSTKNMFSFLDCRYLKFMYSMGISMVFFSLMNSLLFSGSFLFLVESVLLWVSFYYLFRMIKSSLKSWSLRFKSPFKMGFFMSLMISMFEVMSNFVRSFVVSLRFLMNLGVGHLIMGSFPLFLYMEVFVVLLQSWVMYMLLESFATH